LADGTLSILDLIALGFLAAVMILIFWKMYGSREGEKKKG
jgi:hypothetical protein